MRLRLGTLVEARRKAESHAADTAAEADLLAQEAGAETLAAEEAMVALERSEMEQAAAFAVATAKDADAGWQATKLKADRPLQLLLTRAERLRESEVLKGTVVELLATLERDRCATAGVKRQQVEALVVDAERREKLEAEQAEAARLAEASILAPWSAWETELEDDDVLPMQLPTVTCLTTKPS